MPGMLERHRGAILNVASTAAFQPGPNQAVYCAAKAYVLSFTEGSPLLVHRSGKERPGLCSDSTDAGPMRLSSGSPMTSSVLPS